MEFVLALTFLGPPAAAVLVGLLSRRVIIMVMVNVMAIAVAAVPHALMLKNWTRAGTDDWMSFIRRLVLASAILIGVSLLVWGAKIFFAFVARALRKV